MRIFSAVNKKFPGQVCFSCFRLVFPGICENPLFAGIFFSIVLHFLWCVGLKPALPDHSRVRANAVYAGSVLKDSDFVFLGEKKRQKAVKFASDVQKVRHLEKIADFAPKPESPVSKMEKTFEVRDVVESERLAHASRKVEISLKDCDSLLFQADFSDLKRALAREELRNEIVFDVFLNSSGRIEKIRRISGSGDPAIDLFVQSKIVNAVFKPGAAARNCWISVSFKLQ